MQLRDKFDIAKSKIEKITDILKTVGLIPPMEISCIFMFAPEKQEKCLARLLKAMQ